MPGLRKPEAIASGPFKSAKWDELTRGCDLGRSDVPAPSLLCQWYAVVERCMGDLDFGDGLPQVAYQNDTGDLRAMPQLSTMKQASAEIRALNKQLGINDEARRPSAGTKRGSVLQLVIGDRQRKAGQA